ncbi:hypothetical protein RCL1_002003 [Eukaryota sp. TZLM3-RCL]
MLVLSVWSSLGSSKDLTLCRATNNSPLVLTRDITTENPVVTLVTNRDFIPDVIALATSLHVTNRNTSLLCLVSKKIASKDQALLHRYCAEVKLFSPLKMTLSQKLKHLKWHRTGEMIMAVNKIQIWNLNEDSHEQLKKKCLYVDADCLAIRNLDKFKKMQELSAVKGPTKSIINSGVIAFEPSNTTFNKIIEFHASGKFPSGFGDQAVIGNFFKNKNKINFMEGMMVEKTN